MKAETVQVLRLPEADPDVPLPRYATPDAAGADVYANFPDKGEEVLAPGARALIPTGLKMAIPRDFEIQVRPRSGLALKHGVTLVNTPGTIDCDYRGQVGVILINLGDAPFTVRHGERIAQLVLAPVVRAAFQSVDVLDDTDRGSGGFGSTGSN